MEDLEREKFITAVNTPERLARIEEVEAKIKSAVIYEEMVPVVVLSEPLAMQHEIMSTLQHKVAKAQVLYESQGLDPEDFTAKLEEYITKRIRGSLLFCFGFFEDELEDERIARVYENGDIVAFNSDQLVLSRQELV